MFRGMSTRRDRSVTGNAPGTRQRITKTLINETVAPSGTDARTGYSIQDDEVPGLSVRFYPNGKKVWRLYYRADGRQRRMVLGDATAVHPDKARRVSRSLLGAVAEGRDPARERTERREAPTVNELADRYLEEHARPFKKTAGKDERNLDNHVRPALGRMLVRDVKPADVERLHRSMKAKPGAANRVASLLQKMFNLALRWGWYEGHNPVRGLRRYPERKVHRHLSEIELARLAKALREAEARVPRQVAILRFAMLTGCRIGEILTLTWDGVDLERGFVHLSDAKAGPRSFPLNTAARDLLAVQPRGEECPYVFPSTSTRRPDRPFVDINSAWHAIRKAAKLEDLRIHDLRHLFAETAATGGLSLPMIGRLLGHKTPLTTARYAELADDPARVATEQVGARLAAALDSVGVASATSTTKPGPRRRKGGPR